MFVRMCACVCAGVRACVRAHARTRVRVCECVRAPGCAVGGV